VRSPAKPPVCGSCADAASSSSSGACSTPQGFNMQEGNSCITSKRACQPVNGVRRERHATDKKSRNDKQKAAQLENIKQGMQPLIEAVGFPHSRRTGCLCNCQLHATATSGDF